MIDDPAFKCGHPRTPENSKPTGPANRNGGRYVQCSLCTHAKAIVKRVRHDQTRINAGIIIGARAASAWL